MTNDAHARPSGAEPEPLYDVTVPTPTHAERARTLVSQLTTGTLCTLAADPTGYPYGSFVTVAFDKGNPVFLVSTMAEHTRNLQQDPRASLLVAEGGSEDPLANGRVTLLGLCRQIEGDNSSARASFLTTHQNARYYADFRDFAFWQLQVESIRYIGGYGRMSWVEAADWYAAEPDPLASSAAGVIEHMNQDHPEALLLYCKAFSKATNITAASMTEVDRYGFEMSVVIPEGRRPVRLAFDQTVATPEEVRTTLISMVQEARSRLA